MKKSSIRRALGRHHKRPGQPYRFPHHLPTDIFRDFVSRL
jgi:hypothetical protein